MKKEARPPAEEWEPEEGWESFAPAPACDEEKRGRESPAAPSAFEPAPGAGKRKGRKSRKRPEALSTTAAPSGWSAWIDPASLLWLPLLAPILALTMGAALFSLRLPDVSNADGGKPVSISGLFGVACFALGAIPLALVLTQTLATAREWALGARRDPVWPGFDVNELTVSLLRWAICGAMASLALTPLYFAPMPNGVWRFAAPILCLFTAGYFCVALLAVALFDSATACNPLAVMTALFRMSQGRGKFWLEVAAHLAVHFGMFRAILAVWEKAFDVGILIWVLWWGLGILMMLRLMRATAMYYAANAERTGWFVRK